MKPGQREKVAGGNQRRERQDSVTRRVYIAPRFRKARDSTDVHKESSVRWFAVIEREVELTRLRLSISLSRRIFGRAISRTEGTTDAW
jgi:hypothetical protein